MRPFRPAEDQMALKLRVISDHYRQLGKRSSCLFGLHGGRIGRNADNDLVLPDADRYVSSHHAKISFRSGKWIVEDTSTNGVFINGADTPIAVEGPHVLKDGDRLRMGDYELLVSIDERSDFPADASGQMPAPSIKRKPAPDPDYGDLGEALDITDLLSDGTGKFRAPAPTPAEPPRKVRSVPASEAISLLPEDSGEQRTVVHSKRPAEWQVATRPYIRDKAPAATSPGRSEPERIRKTIDGGELHSAIDAFCRGAGIDPSALPLEAQTNLLALSGQMMRELVLGLMEVLKERANVKQRFKIGQTTIQPGNNNPLKFSASVDEALRKLFDGHNSRYLGPIEALREVFTDIKVHQAAINGSMQQGLDELMTRIKPSDMQERFDRGLKRGSLLGATNKMKYWDLYAEFYQVLNQRDEQGLPAAFAEDFARAYEEKTGDGKAGLKRR